MSNSTMMRPGDARALVALVGECRELGDDWEGWWRHWAAGLMRLVDADLSIVGELADTKAPQFRFLSPPITAGREGFAFNPGDVLRVVEDFSGVPGASHFANEYLLRMREDDGVALRNRDLFSAREWRGSVDLATVGEAYGTDSTLLCVRRLDRVPRDESLDATFFRAKGRRNFSARDCTLVREALAATTPLAGGPLARFADPSPADLPPRARQVLACFLQGDGDKQVAARLGIGAHTVNQYAKAIFRHFGVRSRGELLARWVRRGYGGKFPWTDGP